MGKEVGNPFTFLLDYTFYVAAIQTKYAGYLKLYTGPWYI